MKKIAGFLVIGGLLIAIALVCGCTQPPAPGGEEQLTELRIGYQPSTHQLAFMTASDKGWWEEDLAPFGVETVSGTEFPTGAPEMQAMLAGNIDVAYVGAAPVISALTTGLDAKIVAGVQIQGSNLVVRTEIPYEGPDDLRGLKIATFPAGTIQDTLLRSWLLENGIDPTKDVDIRGMGPGDAVTAISAGQVDAVFLPHPAPAVIEVEGKGRSVVASGEMAPNHACCVLVVSGELISEHPDLVEQIIRTHIKATDYNKENLDEAAEIFSRRTGFDVDTVKKSFADWDGEWIYDPSILTDSVVDYAQIQFDLGYIEQPLTEEDIFDTTFFENVQESP